MSILKNRLIRELRSLRLPPEHFAVAGSGPLLAHGVKHEISDLDVVAREAAWSKAVALSPVPPQPAPFGHANVLYFFGGDVEILDAWFPPRWNVDEIIDSAEVFEGIRFAQLQRVLEWKIYLGRDKDLEDIALMQRYLKAQ